jgi:outer membrane murein-binding lipoprotein Lpp
MTLNGRTPAVVLSIVLTGGVGWSTYVTRQLSSQQTQLAAMQAVLEERTASLEKRMDQLARQSDIAALRDALREVLASPPAGRYNHNRP